MFEKTLQFEFEKSTKNTYRFKEIVPEGEDRVIGTLYIRKDALKGERPKKVIINLKNE